MLLHYNNKREGKLNFTLKSLKNALFVHNCLNWSFKNLIPPICRYIADCNNSRKIIIVENKDANNGTMRRRDLQ